MGDFIIEFDLWQQLKEEIESKYDQDFYNKSIVNLLTNPKSIKTLQDIVMKDVMDGSTYDVIAKKLKISKRVVETLLFNGMKNVKVNNL